MFAVAMAKMNEVQVFDRERSNPLAGTEGPFL